MDRQRKKEEKHLKRKKRLEEAIGHKREQEQQAKLHARYPSIIVEPTGADPEFIALVQSALKKINFDDPSQFSDWDRMVFTKLASHGAPFTIQALKNTANKMVADGDPAGNFLLHAFAISLGTQIFKLIAPADRRIHLPYNEMRVFPVGKEFVLRFAQMQTVKESEGRTVYFSRHRPKVLVNGQELTVGFSRHAIDQIVNRIHTESLEYTPAGDLHALFSHCTHFEVVSLNNGELALTFYDYCFSPGCVHYKTYVKGVLSEENYDTTQGNAYYRVGYCPLVIVGEFAKAKTFLPPGYNNTPEFRAIFESSLPSSEKQRLKRVFEHDAGHILRIEDSLEELRWFHHNSVPQVIQSKTDFFKHS
jgi:hypothetical protein